MTTAKTIAALALAALSFRCVGATAPPAEEPPCGLDANGPDAPGRAAQALTDETGQTAADLSPENPACVNHTGDANTCWKEWLKEPGNVSFTAVARGGLGAGPWPVQDVVTIGSALGFSGYITGVGVDTGQNVYAVSAGSLYIRRAGSSVVERYDRNTNGLRDYQLLSVAGAGPGVAYVGYVGVVTTTEYNDPTDIARSGDLQKIELTPTGIKTTTLDTHNSNYPISGVYDHTRVINDIVIPRRGPAAGEMFVGSEHAVSRYVGDVYVDHRHTSTTVSGATKYGSARALTVLDDGTMWYGSDYRIGGLAWTTRRLEWYASNPWKLPLDLFGTTDDRDLYEGIGVDSHGAIWAAARGKGLAKVVPDSTGKSATVTQYSMPNLLARDLVVDLNDTVWVSTNGGLYRFDPVAQTWSRFSAAGSTSFDLYLDDTVVPRALYIGINGGVVVYRGQ